MNRILAAAALTLVAGSASAASISYSANVPETATNWTDTLALQQFDASLGTLTSATLTLSGTVTGVAKAESLDTSASQITLDLSALIEASVFGQATVAVDVNPADQFVFDAAAFDGTIDFGGTSGINLDTLTDTDTDFTTYTGSELANFIGLGTFDVDLVASGLSVATGAGNLITQFNTNALAEVTIEYVYETAAVPLPAALPLFATALGGLAVARRRRG